MLSRQNPRVKYLRRLAGRRFREQEGKFFAEGIRFAEAAMHSGWPVEMLVYCPDAAENLRVKSILEEAAGRVSLVEVDEPLFRELAGTESPQGVLAVVGQRQTRLEDLPDTGRPDLLVLLDGVQDPGNLGTIVRSADAAGAGGVLLLKGTADAFNPKALRASMGSIFHVPVVQDLAPAEALAFFTRRGIKAVAGDLRGKKAVDEADLTCPCVLVLGSEAFGVRGELLDQVPERVRIPMPGRAESLNVAVSASILLYEAVRQRQTASRQTFP